MGETTTVAPTIADKVKQQVISALDWPGTRTGQHEKNYSREAFVALRQAADTQMCIRLLPQS